MFLNRPEVLALDKALARRYQHKLSRHKGALENRLQRRKEVVKGKGLSLEVAPDEEWWLFINRRVSGKRNIAT